MEKKREKEKQIKTKEDLLENKEENNSVKELKNKDLKGVTGGVEANEYGCWDLDWSWLWDLF